LPCRQRTRIDRSGLDGTKGGIVAEDTFTLYDLKVEAVIPPGKRILCGAKEGDHFILEGEMLRLPAGQGFSIYSLAAVLPLLAAKQRETHAHDWMSTDAEVACPDPKTTAVPLPQKDVP
jgi:uncharacterized repeat protein (TIGR04076 family)